MEQKSLIERFATLKTQIAKELSGSELAVNLIDELSGIEKEVSDIATQKKSSEKQIKQLLDNENNLRATISVIDDILFLIDEDLTICSVWSKKEKNLYHPKELITEKNLSEIIDKELIDKERKIIQKTLLNKTTEVVEFNSSIDEKIFKAVFSYAGNGINNKERVACLLRDITNEKQNEYKLLESEERYRLLSDIAFEGIGIHIKGVVVDVNKAFLAMFGYTRDELLGKNALGMIIAESYQQLVLKNIVKESFDPYVVLGKRKDGSEFPMEIEARNFDYRGERLRVTAFRDQTNKIRIEESLKSALRLNQHQKEVTVEELISIGLEEAIRITYSGFGFFQLVNPDKEHYKLLSWEKKASDITITSNENTIVPGENSIWSDFLLKETAFKGNNYANNNFLVSVNGHEIDTVLIVPIIENHQLKAVFGVANNSKGYSEQDKDQLLLLGENLWIIIKNKKSEEALTESEKRYSFIIENLQDIIWTSDVHGNFTYYSPSAMKWLGYSEDEIDQLSIPKLLHPSIREQYVQQLEIRIGQENNGIETTDINVTVPIIKKDGGIVQSEITASPLRDSNGKYIGLAGITRDVTLRVKAENNLKESELRLKEAISAKDKFLSIIAHDLKSPFSALVGLTELLLERHDKMNSDSRSEIIRSIYTSTERTYNLLENLLAWSAMHTGRKKIEPTLFVLEELIAENIELFNTSIKRKEINILFNSDRKTLVKADKEMINTVLRNIISNALKYTFNHGHIEIKINPSENNSILVTIKDSGIGISDTNIEKLFKIDSNFCTPGLENEKGTGLGLILCKEFIEKNNGKIWASSEPGQGAEFSFTLPFASN